MVGWLICRLVGWSVGVCLFIFLYLFSHVVHTEVLVLSLRLGSIESECGRYAQCAQRDQDQAGAG